MEPVENLICIDQELDSRINLLSLSSSKTIKNKSGTFIIENEGYKIEPIANNVAAMEMHSPKWKRNERLDSKGKSIRPSSFNDRKYNPNDYKKKSIVPSEVPKSGITNQNDQSPNNSTSDEEELQDYLTKEVNAKIVSLKLKNNYLTQVLIGSEKKIKQMVLECDENKKLVKEANKEAIRLQKIVTSLNDRNAKKDKDLKDIQEKQAAKSRLCMELNKKINSFERTSREDNKKLLTCQQQNNRLKEQLDAAKNKINILSSELKGEKETYSAQLAASGKKCQDLQNKVKTLLSLIKKQDELNLILQQQKSNIAAAKAAMCLEDQFLSLVEPFRDLNR